MFLWPGKQYHGSKCSIKCRFHTSDKLPSRTMNSTNLTVIFVVFWAVVGNFSCNTTSPSLLQRFVIRHPPCVAEVIIIVHVTCLQWLYKVAYFKIANPCDAAQKYSLAYWGWCCFTGLWWVNTSKYLPCCAVALSWPTWVANVSTGHLLVLAFRVAKKNRLFRNIK